MGTATGKIFSSALDKNSHISSPEFYFAFLLSSRLILLFIARPDLVKTRYTTRQKKQESSTRRIGNSCFFFGYDFHFPLKKYYCFFLLPLLFASARHSGRPTELLPPLFHYMDNDFVSMADQFYPPGNFIHASDASCIFSRTDRRFPQPSRLADIYLPSHLIIASPFDCR